MKERVGRISLAKEPYGLILSAGLMGILTFVGAGYLHLHFGAMPHFELIVRSAIVAGLYISMLEVDVQSLWHCRGPIARVLLVGLPLKVILPGLLLSHFSALDLKTACLYATVVAQIDPIATNELLRSHPHLNKTAETTLRVWSSFDNPITILLAFCIFLPWVEGNTSNLWVGVETLKQDLIPTVIGLLIYGGARALFTLFKQLWFKQLWFKQIWFKQISNSGGKLWQPVGAYLDCLDRKQVDTVYKVGRNLLGVVAVALILWLSIQWNSFSLPAVGGLLFKPLVFKESGTDNEPERAAMGDRGTASMAGAKSQAVGSRRDRLKTVSDGLFVLTAIVIGLFAAPLDLNWRFGFGVAFSILIAHIFVAAFLLHDNSAQSQPWFSKVRVMLSHVNGLTAVLLTIALAAAGPDKVGRFYFLFDTFFH